MLKLIPKAFTSELLQLIMDMGHGEKLLISDANYPWRSAGNKPVFLPVPSIDTLLRDILQFFPLDQSQEHAALVMESAVVSGAFQRYSTIIDQSGEKTAIETVERFAFYERARDAIGVVVTADVTKGGNILLVKGSVVD
jgi:L-fucose mutarotase